MLVQTEALKLNIAVDDDHFHFATGVHYVTEGTHRIRVGIIQSELGLKGQILGGGATLISRSDDTEGATEFVNLIGHSGSFTATVQDQHVIWSSSAIVVGLDACVVTSAIGAEHHEIVTVAGRDVIQELRGVNVHVCCRKGLLDHCRELAPEGFTHAHVDTTTGRATTNIVSVMQHTRIQGIGVEIITTVRGKVAHAGDVRCVKIPEVYILTRATN